MSTHRLVVFSRPKPGKDAEYNDWYQQTHLPEVLAVEGFVAAQRFALSDTQVGDVAGEAPAPYLAIYEVEAPSLEAALGKLNAMTGEMDMGDSIDLENTVAFAYSATGERLESA